MGILVLASTSGAPGTTTTAVGLALAWPRAVLLVDADPGAHQAVLAGFLTGQSSDGKGLLRVAEAHRDRRDLLDVVIDQTVPLSADGTESRRFLPGFVRPGSSALFAGVWSDLLVALNELGDRDVDVIVDAGRFGSQPLPSALAEGAHLIAVVTASNLRSVVSARVNAPSLTEQAGGRGEQQRVGLVVVRPGEPYAGAEIAAALRLPLLAVLPDDAAAAAHLSDGRSRPRKFEQSPLVRALHTTAVEFATRIDRSAALIRG